MRFSGTPLAFNAVVVPCEVLWDSSRFNAVVVPCEVLWDSSRFNAVVVPCEVLLVLIPLAPMHGTTGTTGTTGTLRKPRTFFFSEDLFGYSPGISTTFMQPRNSPGADGQDTTNLTRNADL